MNIRTNPDTDVTEIQVSETEWRSVEEIFEEAGDRSLRTYLLEKYGKVYDGIPKPA